MESDHRKGEDKVEDPSASRQQKGEHSTHHLKAAGIKAPTKLEEEIKEIKGKIDNMTDGQNGLLHNLHF